MFSLIKYPLAITVITVLPNRKSEEINFLPELPDIVDTGQNSSKGSEWPDRHFPLDHGRSKFSKKIIYA